MNFYDRYINGEDGRSVYKDIYTLGQQAYSNKYYADVEKTVTETFKRVAYNLDVIFFELKKIEYNFITVTEYNFQKPLLSPLPNTNNLFIKLQEAVKGFGYLPLSLKLFYQIVGSCNFAWDYDTDPDLLWRLADPIQINSLDGIVAEVMDEYWKETMLETIENNDLPHIELAADYLHKDNISGGPAYAIQITKEPSVDSLFLNERHNTTFVNYLRICMENCGFPGITDPKLNNNYHAFFDNVQPLLKKI